VFLPFLILETCGCTDARVSIIDTSTAISTLTAAERRLEEATYLPWQDAPTEAAAETDPPVVDTDDGFDWDQVTEPRDEATDAPTFIERETDDGFDWDQETEPREEATEAPTFLERETDDATTDDSESDESPPATEAPTFERETDDATTDDSESDESPQATEAPTFERETDDATTDDSESDESPAPGTSDPTFSPSVARFSTDRPTEGEDDLQTETPTMADEETESPESNEDFFVADDDLEFPTGEPDRNDKPDPTPAPFSDTDEDDVPTKAPHRMHRPRPNRAPVATPTARAPATRPTFDDSPPLVDLFPDGGLAEGEGRDNDGETQEFWMDAPTASPAAAVEGRDSVPLVETGNYENRGDDAASENTSIRTSDAARKSFSIGLVILLSVIASAMCSS
jgi:hypothetical protein